MDKITASTRLSRHNSGVFTGGEPNTSEPLKSTSCADAYRSDKSLSYSDQSNFGIFMPVLNSWDFELILWVIIGGVFAYWYWKASLERKQFRQEHSEEIQELNTRKVRDTTGEEPLFVSQYPKYLGTKFEFYDDFFRSSRGQEVLYSEINTIRPFHYRGVKGIILTMRLQDLDVPFILRSNSFNKQMGKRLFDFLASKVPDTQLE
jgi:hypothetical protein